MANTQKDFNNIVTSEIINAYIKRMSGESVSSIDSIEKLSALNFFPARYISRLNDGDKQKLLNIFNDCAKQNDFRKFIQVVETKVPGTLNRTLDGYIKEYKNFVNLPENKVIENFTYRDLYDSLDQSRIGRFIDRLFGMQNFRSMSKEKSDGFSGRQISRILSGLYFIKDEFDSKKDRFEHFSKLQDLFLEKRSIVDHFKKKDEELSKEFFKNVEDMGINSRQIQDVLVGGDSKDYALNRVDFFETTSIEDLEKIAELDEKMTSIVAVPFIKNLLGLSNNEGFKDLNELNPRQLKDLETLLSRKEGDTRAIIMDRLAKFSNVIENVVDKTYNNFSDLIKRSNGESLFSKEEITDEIVNALAEQGAFAKETVQDFAYAATNITLNNDLFINKFEKEKISGLNKDFASIDDGNICYIQLEGKVYELNGLNAVESEPGIYTLPSESFEEMKNKLASIYGVSFENIDSNDIKIGINPLAENFLDIAVEQEKLNTKNADEKVSEENQNNYTNQDISTQSQEIKVQDKTSSNSYTMSSSSGFTIFTGSEVYLEALEEARKRVREYILTGRVEFINKESVDSQDVNSVKELAEGPQSGLESVEIEENNDEISEGDIQEEGNIVEGAQDEDARLKEFIPYKRDLLDHANYEPISKIEGLEVEGGDANAPTASEVFKKVKQEYNPDSVIPYVEEDRTNNDEKEKEETVQEDDSSASTETELEETKKGSSNNENITPEVTEQEGKQLEKKVEELNKRFIIGQSPANVIEYSDGSKIVVFSKDGKDVGMFYGSTKGSRGKRVGARDLKRIKAELENMERQNELAHKPEDDGMEM